MRFRRALIWMMPLVASCVLAQPIQLVLDDMVVDSENFTQSGCLQVPIYIVDPAQNRDLVLLSFTLDITGNTEIIAGGVTGDMLVVNSFFNVGDPSGITNPPTPLVNQANLFDQPDCGSGVIFNPATQNTGPAADFYVGTGLGSWAVNNNRDGNGRKFALVFNPSANSMGQTLAGQRLLVGVLVIPIIANPGAARLNITATPEAVFPSGNAFSWTNASPEDAAEADDTEGGLFSDLMDLSRADVQLDLLSRGQPVPALGPWGMGILGVVLMATALVMRRRQGQQT